MVVLGKPIDLQKISSTKKVFKVMELDDQESADLLPRTEKRDQSTIIDFPKWTIMLDRIRSKACVDFLSDEKLFRLKNLRIP